MINGGTLVAPRRVFFKPFVMKLRSYSTQSTEKDVSVDKNDQKPNNFQNELDQLKILIDGNKVKSFMVKNPDGTMRPRSTASFKRVQMKGLIDEISRKDQIAKQSGFTRPWDYKASFIFIRAPICTPELTEEEKEYEEWLNRWRKPIIDKTPDLTSLFTDAPDPLAAREEDLSLKEITDDMTDLEKYQIQKAKEIRKERELLREPGPRIREADKTGDTKDLIRKIDEFLYLVVKKNRKENQWQFPQLSLPLNHNAQSKTTLSDYFTRETKDILGKNLKVYIPGNSPIACYSYPYPQEHQELVDSYGAKLFFYRGYYCDGDVNTIERYVDHAWLTKSELETKLEDAEMRSFLCHILPSS